MKSTSKRFLISFLVCCLLLSGVSVSAAASSKAKAMGKMTLTAGVKKTLTISNTGNKKVSWKSSKTKVASVTQKGVVTAKKPGTAKITATVGSSSRYTWNITVKAKKISVTRIKLNKSSASLAIGKTLTLKASVSPKNATNKDVAWSSSNPGAASVSEKGVVTAKKTGTAVITATACDGSGRTASCRITVKKPKVTSVLITGAKDTAVIGETFSLKASVSPAGASSAVTWKSSSASIASVSKKGVVKAKKAGTVTITATASDGSKKSASCTIKVVIPKVTSLKITGVSSSLTVGDTKQLSVIASPAGASKKVSWSSSDPSVASVSDTGLVTAAAPGSVTITAAAQDGSQVSTSCKITVEKPRASKLKLDNVPSTLKVGKTCQLTAVVTPKDASQEVTWKSSDPGIATVSDTGLVTAVAPGSVTITAVSASNKNLNISCHITIEAETAEIKSLMLSGNRGTLAAGETMQLEVTTDPADVSVKFIWKSSDTKVASVSQDGLVTAVAPGEATITATVADGSGMFVSTNVKVTEAASKKTVVGITVSCSLSSVSSAKEITADTLTVYEIYEDGSKVRLSGGFSVKVSENSAKDAYVVTVTADNNLTASTTVKKEGSSSSEPAYVRTDISCYLAEVEYGHKFTASEFTVVNVYSDGSSSAAAFEVAVKPYADGYYTVTVTANPGTANAIAKTLQIKVKNPPADETESEEPEQKVTGYRFELNPSYVYVGENFKPGQLRMFVTYSGSDKETEVTDFTCDFTPQNTPGTYTFHITWNGMTNEHSITVREKSSEEQEPSDEPYLTKLTAKYIKRNYIFSDETPAKEDIEVMGTYSDGSTRQITDFTFEFVPASVHKGNAVIKVSYDGNILPPIEVPSYVRTEPESVKYGLAVSSVKVGESLDKSKVVVIAIDYDGHETPVPASDFEIDFTPKSEPGTYSFQISYKGFHEILPIEVVE